MTDGPVRVDASPRPWPTVDARAAERIALLAIDFQVDFVRADGWLGRIGVETAPMRAVLRDAAAVLDAARAAGLHVVHTRQGNAADLSDLPAPRRFVRGLRNEAAIARDGAGLVRGSPGWQIVEEVAPRAGELVIDKVGFSAFAGTDLDAQLRDRRVEAVIVIGVTSNVCVLATLLAAVDLGYDCLLVQDAIAADDPAVTAATLRIVDHEGPLFGARASAAALISALAGPPPPTDRTA